MRRLRALHEARRMNPDHRIVLRLEVDRDADPITGTLSEDEQPRHPFTGWLGLTDAIEDIRVAHGRGPARQDTDETGDSKGQGT